MKPQITPRRGAPQRCDRAAAPVGPAERRVVRGQDLPYLVGPPGLVPRLHREPEPVLAQCGGGGPELLQARVQRFRVGLQRRRQLEQDRPEFGPQPRRRAEQPGHRLGRVAQPTHVGQIPAGLDRHDEVVRGPFPPSGERLPRRQPVEAVVVLHGQVVGGVALQPQALGHALGVQSAPPVTVLPARGPDQHRHRRYLPTGPGSTQNSLPSGSRITVWLSRDRDDVGRDLGNDMFPVTRRPILCQPSCRFPEQCFSVDFPSSATYIKRHGDVPGAAA